MKRLVTDGATVDQATVDSSARDRVRARRMARKKKKTLRVAVLVLLIVGSLVGAYAYGFSFYSSHFFAGTRIAGVDAAGMTETELAQAIDSRLQSFTAHVTNGEFELDLAGSAVNLTGDASTISHNHMVYQDASSWPLAFLGVIQTNDPVLTFDTGKLALAVSEAVGTYNNRAKQPVSATLVLNEDKDAFTIKPERVGTALESSRVYNAVQDSLARGESQIILPASALVQPAYKADSPQTKEALKHVNEVLTYDINLTHNGRVLSHLTSESFAPWLSVLDDLSLGVDQEAAALWAEQELWLVADYADDKDAYSVDAKTFAQDLSGCIRWENGAAFNIPYLKTARYLPGGGKLNPTPWNPELGRYIDVSIKDQVACLFDTTGRVLFEAPVTTGNGTDGVHATPVGKYAIYDKKADVTLTGLDEDNDGESDYATPVNCWLPFNRGIGLHDASWRHQFGGDVYLTRGTHGCVSFSVEDMPPLFAMAHPGDVVYVHE